MGGTFRGTCRGVLRRFLRMPDLSVEAGGAGVWVVCESLREREFVPDIRLWVGISTVGDVEVGTKSSRGVVV